ncbi:YflJ family protein [Bacillus fonticola]|uniref:YflJ family protein n=1 Tax=Bacillus fonticola TaxID=2728853 RepID=UPI00147530FE|nr:YflJ family protein [Bacillus fonticola]
MAYFGSKGWFVQQLKENGIRYHPVERKKLETYKTHILRNLYRDLVENKSENK